MVVPIAAMETRPARGLGHTAEGSAACRAATGASSRAVKIVRMYFMGALLQVGREGSGGVGEKGSGGVGVWWSGERGERGSGGDERASFFSYCRLPTANCRLPTSSVEHKEKHTLIDPRAASS